VAYSMTGFGRGEAKGGPYHFTIELKSVNSRFLEVVVRLPRAYSALEEPLRREIQAKVQRGRLEVLANVVETQEKKRLVKVDKDLALIYDKTLKDLALALQTPYAADIYKLVSLPEVLAVEEQEPDLELLEQLGSQALSQALAGLLAMRKSEGDKLAADLLARLQVVAGLGDRIAALSENVVKECQERLRARIQTLLGEVVLDEARLANEVAFLAERASIAEELVRLGSHVQQGRQALMSDQPVGRKLDFIVQEMNREINTIGSKANDLTISQAVIELKSELEKIREQIQNLE